MRPAKCGDLYALPVHVRIVRPFNAPDLDTPGVPHGKSLQFATADQSDDAQPLPLCASALTRVWFENFRFYSLCR